MGHYDEQRERDDDRAYALRKARDDAARANIERAITADIAKRGIVEVLTDIVHAPFAYRDRVLRA